jgi:hypothetical protein
MYIEAKFLGGEDIENACRDAIALANRIGCDVHFQFNDVTCMAMAGHRARDLLQSWREVSQTDSDHKIATSHLRG